MATVLFSSYGILLIVTAITTGWNTLAIYSQRFIPGCLWQSIAGGQREAWVMKLTLAEPEFCSFEDAVHDTAIHSGFWFWGQWLEKYFSSHSDALLVILRLILCAFYSIIVLFVIIVTVLL